MWTLQLAKSHSENILRAKENLPLLINMQEQEKVLIMELEA